MKIGSEFLVRNIAGERVLIPTGKAAMHNSGIITLNESGAMLVEKLREECSLEELVDCLMAEYDVPRDVAERDVLQFLDKLKERELYAE